ncbi:MAG: hypothetical protein HY537_06500 [Deltaproteobacteria bacterium]|nr:hypothetical protein [Deltaproteobacteria bacterium]
MGWRAISGILVVCFVCGECFAVQCGSAVVRASARFDRLWSKDFSTYPTLEQTFSDRKLREQVREGLLASELRPEVETFLKQGGDPFLLGSLHSSLARAYEKIVEQSQLPDKKKRVLGKALKRAVAFLSKNQPSGLEVEDGGAGGDGGAGEDGGARDDGFSEGFNSIFFYQYLNGQRLRQCITQTSVLFIVSNIFNTAGALEAKWSEYAGEDVAYLLGTVSESTWQQAFSDPDFRHNVTWNAILMISLGASSCLKSTQLGKNAVGLVALATSAAGQYLSTGKISVRQLAVDTVFVRYVSVNKSYFAFFIKNVYIRPKLPVPYLFEASLYAVSESFGAWAYPRATTASKSIWKD